MMTVITKSEEEETMTFWTVFQNIEAFIQV